MTLLIIGVLLVLFIGILIGFGLGYDRGQVDAKRRWHYGER